MPKLPKAIRPILSPAALDDVREALRWSERNFGKAAALRYEGLIVQAVQDLVDDPLRPGSRTRPELICANARTYHIELSRSRTSEPRVKVPRHIVLYRFTEPGVIEIARILYDTRDLALHLPEDYKP